MGESEKEHFVLGSRTFRFIFPEHFVLRIIEIAFLEKQISNAFTTDVVRNTVEYSVAKPSVWGHFWVGMKKIGRVLHNAPTETIIGFARWNSKNEAQSIANVIEGFTADFARIGFTYASGGNKAVGTLASMGVHAGVWGVGKLIDMSGFNEWLQKRYEKKYVKNYLINK